MVSIKSNQQSFDPELEAALRLVENRLMTGKQLDLALRARERDGSPLSYKIVAEGYVRRLDYYKAMADVLGCPFVDFQDSPPDPSLHDIDSLADCRERLLIPWRREGGKLIIASAGLNDSQLAWADQHYGRGNYGIVITSPFDILWHTQKLYRSPDTEKATEHLHRSLPRLSAKYTLSKSQKVGFLLLSAALVASFLVAPARTSIIAMAVVTIVYNLTFAFKFMLTWIGASRELDMGITSEEVDNLDPKTLPAYSILVPMYREAKVLPLIVDALRKIDYPSDRLDIKLVLEEDDLETIDAAKAMSMPGSFEIMRVPPSSPKTKPKACNYALQFCRGEFVTIYDAEDQPEPDQLKKAIVAFRKSPGRMACFQARLNYFNRKENWLTRMFTLEYSQWFDFLLPGLDWLRVPIPLGGTSNHFRRSALLHVGAWDPYNVTEDADLGIRLAQHGYTVGVINSTTFEEANGVLGSWINQRSRWVKGYMLTWLVHMRHPVRLWRTIGIKGFLSFQFFIGAPPFMMMLNPILWFLAIVFFFLDRHDYGWLFPEPVGTMALFNLVIGNLFLAYFGVVAALKRRYFDLVFPGLLQPLYWVLHSAASYKAFWQLVFNPHYWEKTEHGTSGATDAALQSLAEARP